MAAVFHTCKEGLEQGSRGCHGFTWHRELHCAKQWHVGFHCHACCCTHIVDSTPSLGTLRSNSATRQKCSRRPTYPQQGCSEQCQAAALEHDTRLSPQHHSLTVALAGFCRPLLDRNQQYELVLDTNVSSYYRSAQHRGVKRQGERRVYKPGSGASTPLTSILEGFISLWMIQLVCRYSSPRII